MIWLFYIWLAGFPLHFFASALWHRWCWPEEKVGIPSGDEGGTLFIIGLTYMFWPVIWVICLLILLYDLWVWIVKYESKIKDPNIPKNGYR